jgi:folate-dependent phosphoribosylglycinamide formyltransferase PurN
MKILPIFKPDRAGRPMRVAAFMSGSGTNIIKLLELEKKLKSEEGASPFNVIFIFSDRADGSCRGEQIAHENGIPYFSYDIRVFYRRRKAKRTVASPEGLALRKEFDSVAARLVKAFEIDLNALGGYMSYITLDRCINVHPADLSILTPEGKRRFVGDHAVLDALLAGERSLSSSTIWTDRGVDTGPLLMVSHPLKIQISESPESLTRDRGRLMKIVEEYQERLKREGDWQIFPRTIEMIARGRFALDEDNRVYVDGLPVPNGYREDPRLQGGASPALL